MALASCKATSVRLPLLNSHFFPSFPPRFFFLFFFFFTKDFHNRSTLELLATTYGPVEACGTLFSAPIAGSDNGVALIRECNPSVVYWNLFNSSQIPSQPLPTGHVIGSDRHVYLADGILLALIKYSGILYPSALNFSLGNPNPQILSSVNLSIPNLGIGGVSSFFFFSSFIEIFFFIFLIFLGKCFICCRHFCGC